MYHLVLPPRFWREGFRQLARDDHGGWAYLRRSVQPGGCELIGAQHLSRLTTEERGRDFGPLDDLLLVRLSEQVPPQAAAELLANFQPGGGQLVVALVIGIGPAAGQWLGAVCDRGRLAPLDSFQLIGPGMRRVSLHPDPPLADPHDRWSRTRGALGDDVWRRVRASRVAVIGASRTGSVAAFAFAMLGVRELVLIDPDRDEWHNLDATLGATPEGLGEYKVLNRRAALLASRPDDLAVQAVPLSLPHPEIEARLRGVDLICTCVDRDAARLVVARLANRWSKLHLDIGAGVFGQEAERVQGGDIRLLLPGDACVVCLGGLRDLNTAELEADAPPGALRRGRRLAWHEQRAGSLLTVNTVAVHLGIQMWLDLLASRITESRWLHLEWDAHGTSNSTITNPPRVACRLCRPSPTNEMRWAA